MCEDNVGVGPKAGCDQHGVDDEGEHDVCECKGDDEHLHGAELSFAELQNQNDQQVENAAHKNYISNLNINPSSSSKQTDDEEINSNCRVFCLLLF